MKFEKIVIEEDPYFIIIGDISNSITFSRSDSFIDNSEC